MRLAIGTAFLCVLLTAETAQAGLMGTTMSVTYNYPDASTVYGAATYNPQTFTIGGGIDTEVIVEGVTTILVDFAVSSLYLTLETSLTSPTWNTSSFNGLVFTALSGPPDLTGAVTSGSTMTGFDNSRVSLSGDQILLNWNGLSYQNGTVVDIDFKEAAVPEPSTLALFAGGLMGAGVIGRYRRKDLFPAHR